MSPHVALARCIIRAQAMVEGSWNPTPSDASDDNGYILNRSDASAKACRELGFPELAIPVGLLLEESWNDSEAFASDVMWQEHRAGRVPDGALYPPGDVLAPMGAAVAFESDYVMHAAVDASHDELPAPAGNRITRIG